MTLHADASAVLVRWRDRDPRQEQLRTSYVAHLAAHADGLARTCRPAHVTASVVLLDAAHEQVLLTLHAKAQRWFQLGGHCEPGDRTLAGAALREAREESGLADLELDPEPVHLDRHEVDFCGGALAVHLDVRFLAVAPAGAVARSSVESLEVGWWPVTELPDPELAELVSRGVARARGRSSTDTPTERGRQ